MKPQGYSKELRLLKAFEFRRARQRGGRRRTANFSFCVWKRDGTLRLGISVGREAGGAVRRNWIKRRIREFFRLNRQAIGFSGDVIVSGLSKCGLVKGSELEKELNKGLEVKAERTQV